MSNDPFRIADQILQTRQELLKYEIEGTFWSGAEVRQMTEALYHLAMKVRLLAEELRNIRQENTMKNNIQSIGVNDNDASNVVIFSRRAQQQTDDIA